MNSKLCKNRKHFHFILKSLNPWRKTWKVLILIIIRISGRGIRNGRLTKSKWHFSSSPSPNIALEREIELIWEFTLIVTIVVVVVFIFYHGCCIAVFIVFVFFCWQFMVIVDIVCEELLVFLLLLLPCLCLWWLVVALLRLWQ